MLKFNKLLALSVVLLLSLLYLGFTLLKKAEIESDIQAGRVLKINVSYDSQHVKSNEIKPELQQFLNSEFVDLDLRQVEQKLKQNPWIDDVTVRKQWPDKLIVNISNHLAVAKWKKEGYGYLNPRGQLFVLKDKANLPDTANLVVFDGPAGTEKELLTIYAELKEMLKDSGYRISYLQRNDIGVYEMTLDNQLKVLLGRRQVKRRMERLTRALALFDTSDMEKIESLDLRYGRGLAIRIKS